MKKIAILIVVATSITSHAYVKKYLDKAMSNKTQKTVVPCAAALLAPMILGSPESMAIGAATCAAVAGYNYVDDSMSYDEQESIRQKTDKFIEQSRKDLKENFEKTKKNYAYYQEIIRDSVGQKFAEFDSEINESIKRHMRKPAIKHQIKELVRELGPSSSVSEKEKEAIKEEILRDVSRALSR